MNKIKQKNSDEKKFQKHSEIFVKLIWWIWNNCVKTEGSAIHPQRLPVLWEVCMES